MGRDVLVYRTQSGVVCVSDPYCPHLGAHLGHGGCIKGENITCPFHEFEFDPAGECVATPYGEALPKKARLGQWPVREQHGLILAYFHPAGRHVEPDWEVPALPTEGWTALRRHTFEVASHPQETSENSVDVGHFKVVHGYDHVEVIRSAQVDGRQLTATYGMVRQRSFPSIAVRTEFDVCVDGLGHSTVNIRIPQFGLAFRTFILSTPTTAGMIDLRIAIAVQEIQPSSRLAWLARLLPKMLLERLISRAALASLHHDVTQDLELWRNKTYVDQPRLARGDGPIGLYRRWTRQFYPSPLVRQRRKGA